MKNFVRSSLLSSVAAFALLPSAAGAQGTCLEGVAANGECVDPPTVVTMRQQAVIFSQPKISYTAYPILPAGDYDYRYPHQLNPDQSRPAPANTPE